MLVAACFDTHEELWVNADGSARAEFVYHIPKKALLALGGSTGLERQVRELVGTQPELRLDSLKIDRAGDDIELAAHLSTDSLLWLRDIKKNAALSKIPESTTDFAGVFKVKLESLKVDFSRTLNIGHALGLSSFLIGQEDRENRHFCCVIHLPLPAIESNATRTEDGGRTLIWDTPLGDALKGPVITRFRAPIPLPHWLVPASAGAVALLGLISWQVVRWRRR
jgi:hypothetical protein